MPESVRLIVQSIQANQTDEDTLSNLITYEMLNMGFDLSGRVVGLRFEGASNMSGVNKGVAIRFKNWSPLAIYVQRYGRLSSFATKDTLSSVPLLHSTLGMMQQLCVFLEVSLKWHTMFLKQEDVGRILKSFSVTPWTASSMKGIEAELPNIIKTLN